MEDKKDGIGWIIGLVVLGVLVVLELVMRYQFYWLEGTVGVPAITRGAYLWRLDVIGSLKWVVLVIELVMVKRK
jgi:hypothetical protein